jgi:hypothetical protein
MREMRSFASIPLIAFISMKLPKLSVVGSIPIARSNLRCAAAWIVHCYL